MRSIIRLLWTKAPALYIYMLLNAFIMAIRFRVLVARMAGVAFCPINISPRSYLQAMSTQYSQIFKSRLSINDAELGRAIFPVLDVVKLPVERKYKDVAPSQCGNKGCY